MIFFVPGYDPATEANLAVVERLLPQVCRPLLRDRATREALLASLEDMETPLFAMAHGRRDILFGQGHTHGLTEDDFPSLGWRTVFAYACHTAGGLGPSMARGGAVWWGYTGAVTAPEASPSLLDLFVRIFSFIRDEFALSRSPEAREAVLLRLADLCHQAEMEIDDLYEEDPELDAGSAYLCLLHIWQRLRVWGPESQIPLMHPDAPPPALFP